MTQNSIRPLDILVGGLIFYCDSSSSFFFRQLGLPFKLAERNSTKIGHMLITKCCLKMYVQNLRYTFPLKIGGPNPRFSCRLRNLTATLMVYISGTKQYAQSSKCVDNHKVSPTSSQNDLNFGPLTASNWTIIFTHCK